MAVRMELSRIFIREMKQIQIIELSELDGERTFPIVIGLPEAFAIERRLKGGEIARPQTHDLLASVIRDLGGQIKEIVINDLRHGTFYATIVVEQDGQDIEIDSRPSDAIALGVAQDVPIYVTEHVLSQTESDGVGEFGYEADDEAFDLGDSPESSPDPDTEFDVESEEEDST